MEDKRLPPRLRAIAQWVPQGAKLADIGTDHALLPLWLLRRERISAAIATDINELPLNRAQTNAREAGENRIRFLLCDGLAGVEKDMVDTIVIAGLGGENIADILKRSPWACSPVITLILQPMSRTEVLCHSFFELGLSLLQETLVVDSGRVYPIFMLSRGTMDTWREGEYYTGPFSFLANSPYRKRFLEEQQRRLSGVVNGLTQASREEKRLPLYKKALEDITAELVEKE